MNLIDLQEKNKPPVVNYGKEMNHGCAGFARDVLHWPGKNIQKN